MGTSNYHYTKKDSLCSFLIADFLYARIKEEVHLSEVIKSYNRRIINFFGYLNHRRKKTWAYMNVKYMLLYYAMHINAQRHKRVELGWITFCFRKPIWIAIFQFYNSFRKHFLWTGSFVGKPLQACFKFYNNLKTTNILIPISMKTCDDLP